jgi:hypothetical protein
MINAKERYSLLIKTRRTSLKIPIDGEKEKRKMKTDYSKMTQQDFDNILFEKLENMKASEIIRLPGIYEIVSEEFNNEILSEWDAEQERKKETFDTIIPIDRWNEGIKKQALVFVTIQEYPEFTIERIEDEEGNEITESYSEEDIEVIYVNITESVNQERKERNDY